MRKVKPYRVLESTNETTADKVNVDHEEAYHSTDEVSVVPT